MRRLVVGLPLVFVGLVATYGAWASWEVLTKPAAFLLGGAIGACLTAGFFVLGWRPAHPATRYQSTLPSPWDRKRWR
jgi:hypothetical protein